ncbi:hypothetical protein MCERE1_01609 [Burkholderiaceae bacterium]
MAQRSGGLSVINKPKPAPHSTNSKAQPRGTAKQKRNARRRPWLAASAVDKVVLGPGEKLTAVHIASKAAHSELPMAPPCGFGWVAPHQRLPRVSQRCRACINSDSMASMRDPSWAALTWSWMNNWPSAKS